MKTYGSPQNKTLRNVGTAPNLLNLFSGQESKQRLATPLTTPKTRNWPSNDANLCGDSFHHLQHFTNDQQCIRDPLLQPPRVDDSNRKSASDDQQQYQLYNLRNFWPEVQETLP